MKGNVLNEVSVREMSVFRHGLSLGSVTSTAPEELYLSSERIAFLLPRESCNYPTHLTNPLLGVHFTSFYILCLKFQICIELHFTKQYFLRHLISLFAYRTAQLVLKMKVEFMVQPISLVSDLKNNNTACLHLIFKDTSSVTLSRRTFSAVCADSRQATMVCSKVTVLFVSQTASTNLESPWIF